FPHEWSCPDRQSTTSPPSWERPNLPSQTGRHFDSCSLIKGGSPPFGPFPLNAAEHASRNKSTDKGSEQVDEPRQFHLPIFCGLVNQGRQDANRDPVLVAVLIRMNEQKVGRPCQCSSMTHEQ